MVGAIFTLRGEMKMAMIANNPGVNILTAKVELDYDQLEVVVTIKYRDYNHHSGSLDYRTVAMELQARLLEVASDYKIRS